MNNDLISREALKKAILARLDDDEARTSEIVEEEIDNAPTVERVNTTKPALVYKPGGARTEGYYDEARQIFFTVGYTKELIDRVGGIIEIEEEQTREGGAE